MKRHYIVFGSGIILICFMLLFFYASASGWGSIPTSSGWGSIPTSSWGGGPIWTIAPTKGMITFGIKTWVPTYVSTGVSTIPVRTIPPSFVEWTPTPVPSLFTEWTPVIKSDPVDCTAKSPDTSGSFVVKTGMTISDASMYTVAGKNDAFPSDMEVWVVDQNGKEYGRGKPSISRFTRQWTVGGISGSYDLAALTIATDIEFPGTYSLKTNHPELIKGASPSGSGWVSVNCGTGNKALASVKKLEANDDCIIFDVWSVNLGQSQPKSLTIFKPTASTPITRIQTYHWNNGKGVTPGSIWLMDKKGNKVGPYKATGVSDKGVMNAIWEIRPYVKIPAGEYTVVDSDSSTWTWNTDTLNRGMARIYGPCGSTGSAGGASTDPGTPGGNTGGGTPGGGTPGGGNPGVIIVLPPVNTGNNNPPDDGTDTNPPDDNNPGTTNGGEPGPNTPNGVGDNPNCGGLNLPSSNTDPCKPSTPTVSTPSIQATPNGGTATVTTPTQRTIPPPTPAPKTTTQTSVSADPACGSAEYNNAVEAEIFRLINNYRQSKGLPPYTRDNTLDTLSSNYATDLLSGAASGHNLDNANDARKLGFNFGRTGAFSDWVGENLGMYQFSGSCPSVSALANSQFEGWKDNDPSQADNYASKGHDKAMLDTPGYSGCKMNGVEQSCGFTKIGLGVVFDKNTGTFRVAANFY